MTTPLGLIMLKTTSEELACPREDLSVARKEELRKLLLDQVQTVLGLLTGEPFGGGQGRWRWRSELLSSFACDRGRVEKQGMWWWRVRSALSPVSGTW